MKSEPSGFSEIINSLVDISVRDYNALDAVNFDYDKLSSWTKREIERREVQHIKDFFRDYYILLDATGVSVDEKIHREAVIIRKKILEQDNAEEALKE